MSTAEPAAGDHGGCARAQRTIGGRLADRWFAPVPASRLAAVRLAVCTYAVLFAAGRAVYLLDASRLPASSWHPLGLASRLDAPPPRAVVLALWLLVLGAGTVAAAGRRTSASLPLLAVAFLLLATYANSWGQLFHTEHLVALHLLVLGAAGGATGRALRLRHRWWERRPGRRPPGDHAAPDGAGAVSGWPLRLMSAVTVITYALAGLAKLRLGGWGWVSGDALRHQVAFDNIRKEVVGSVSSPIAGLLLPHRWVWWPMGIATMLVELGAPLALLLRRSRAAWVAAAWIVAAWLFHVGIAVVMAILFFYPLSGVAFASMLPLERPVARWQAWRVRRTGRTARSARSPRPAPDG